VDWFEWEGSSKESCYFVALEVFVSTRFDLLKCTFFAENECIFSFVRSRITLHTT
jgi:hypothetical protein